MDEVDEVDRMSLSTSSTTSTWSISLVPQRDQRIHARRAAGGEVAG